MRRNYPAADIDVLLPQPGPIVDLLRPNATRILFAPIWVLRRKNLLYLVTFGLLALPWAIVRAWRRMRGYDLVYVNTSVVADHILASRFFRDTVLLHIHEIPEGIVLTVLRALVRRSRAQIIFNSKATKASFALPTSICSNVIYNGIPAPAATLPTGHDDGSPLNVLMLGRINRTKGQEILIEAIARLPQHLKSRILVRIVGNAFEDPSRELMIRSMVENLNLASIVRVEHFTVDPSALYSWSHVVVVPSRKPESLGRVAIEAMAYGRPAVASAIGGLVEVVEDGKTGWLVPPARADLLADLLQTIIENPAAWAEFGSAAQRRYEKLFSERVVSAEFAALLKEKLQGQERELSIPTGSASH